MRQAGVIAAAGIVALEKMVGRLAEDHENVRLLARGLKKIDGIRIDPEMVETNIVFFDLSMPGGGTGGSSERNGAAGSAFPPDGTGAV